MEQNEGKLDQTATRVELLEEAVEDDRKKTIWLIADHCERLDHHSNMAKSHCVLITGIQKLFIKVAIMLCLIFIDSRSQSK